MAKMSYADAMKPGQSQPMSINAPDGRVFNGYYCDPKLDRDTLPAGWHAYDIRHDDDGCGVFVELCHNYVIVNNAGTFFTQTPIPELAKDGASVSFAIDEEEWKLAHDSDTEPVEPNSNAWDYTF